MATKSFHNVDYGGIWLQKSGDVGTKPYIAPNNYNYQFATGKRNGVWSSAVEVVRWLGDGEFASYYADKAYAKAFDKFANKVSSEFTVNLGETVGEGRESFKMMYDRMGQLTRAYSALKRFDVRAMAREFGYRQRRRKQTWVRVGKGGKKHTLKNERLVLSESELKRGVKTPATVWLEYHLGWDPIMKDLYNSLQIVNDIHPLAFKKQVSAKGEYTHKIEESAVIRPYGWMRQYLRKTEGTFKVRISANARVTEPLKRVMADHGITNPVLIAWNLTPGTMFIDWFLPVSKFLNGFTAFYGIELTDIQRTDKRTCVHFETDYSIDSWGWAPVVVNSEGRGFMRRTTPGISSLRVPGLMDRTGTGVGSAARAATAVAVLINMLRN